MLPVEENSIIAKPNIPVNDLSPVSELSPVSDLSPASELSPASDLSPASELSPASDLSPTITSSLTVPPEQLIKGSVLFNDEDNVVKFSKKDKPSDISSTQTNIVSAPKTVERLERLSEERNEKRKIEEEEEEDYSDSIKIFNSSPSPVLGALDIQDISNKMVITTEPLLDGVECLT